MNERPQGAVGAGPIDPATFATLFEACSAPMLISTLADGTYLAANEAFLSVVGYDRDEVIGHSSLEVARWADLSERSTMVQALQE